MFRAARDRCGEVLEALVRICILTRGDLFPTQHGAAVKIVRTAEALSRRGEPCFVVTDDRDHYLRFDDGLMTRVPYPPRIRAAEEWRPLRRLERWAEGAIERFGYPREEVFLYKPQLDPTWWLRAYAVGRQEGVDVFQAEFPGYAVPGLVAARLLGRRGKRPRVSIVQHNVEWARLEEFGHKIGRLRRVEQALVDRVDEVIAVSADDKARMVEAGAAPEGITVIPHGVDLDLFSSASPAGIRARLGVAEGVPLLWFHGTLHYWPNTQAVRFIAEDLLPRLLAVHPDLKVVAAGMNPPTYYAHPSLIFPGPVDDLAAHIAAADLCICPIDAGGGTRMKLLEYMAAGKPTVSTTKGAEGIAYGGSHQREARGVGKVSIGQVRLGQGS
jgi:glycosyltransferase involved in cell wall biosynthesis